jgi:hypothetical protein
VTELTLSIIKMTVTRQKIPAFRTGKRMKTGVIELAVTENEVSEMHMPKWHI